MWEAILTRANGALRDVERLTRLGCALQVNNTSLRLVRRLTSAVRGSLALAHQLRGPREVVSAHVLPYKVERRKKRIYRRSLLNNWLVFNAISFNAINSTVNCTKPVSAQKLALFSKLWNAMATMAAIKDLPTTTAALWQHHILAALPPRNSVEYEYSKIMQDVAIGIHALTAAGKKQTNVSTFATLFQSSAQKLRERETFSAVTRLCYNVIAHNSVRSKRSSVNEGNKTVNVVNTMADDVHQNASRVRIVNQTLMMTVCQPSSRLRFSQPSSVHAAASNRSWKLQRQSQPAEPLRCSSSSLRLLQRS